MLAILDFFLPNGRGDVHDSAFHVTKGVFIIYGRVGVGGGGGSAKPIGESPPPRE